MFAVCSDNRNKRGTRKKRYLTCDVKRYTKRPQLTLNPCDSTTLCKIKYNEEGIMDSDDTDVKDDIQYNITRLCINPTILRMLLDDYDRISCDISSLREIYVHGAKTNDLLGEKARNILKHCNIYFEYGLPEAGSRVSSQKVNILYEPTAALDPNAEYELYTQFNDMVKDKTAV